MRQALKVFKASKGSQGPSVLRAPQVRQALKVLKASKGSQGPSVRKAPQVRQDLLVHKAQRVTYVRLCQSPQMGSWSRVYTSSPVVKFRFRSPPLCVVTASLTQVRSVTMETTTLEMGVIHVA